jgi:hypothetical protein
MKNSYIELSPRKIVEFSNVPVWLAAETYKNLGYECNDGVVTIMTVEYERGEI